MPIEEIAREDVITAEPDDSIAAVVETMRERNVGSIVVVEDRVPVGIVTDRDLVLEVLATDADPKRTLVEEVMTRDPLTVSVDESILGLFREMANASVRRVPVVADGELAGIVTLDDLIVLLSIELQSLANVIRTESPPYETQGDPLF